MGGSSEPPRTPPAYGPEEHLTGIQRTQVRILAGSQRPGLPSKAE